jgi:hypothetical protein
MTNNKALEYIQSNNLVGLKEGIKREIFQEI